MKKFLAVFVASTVLMPGCGESSNAQRPKPSKPAKPTPEGGKRTAAERSELRALVDAMPLREQVGQLVMTKVDGQRLSPADRRLLTDQHVGGVILFGYNYANRRQLRAFSEQMQAAGRRGNAGGIGVLVAIDQEGGAVRRLADLPSERSQVELGRDASVGVVRGEGLRTARGLRGVGINMNLAPVADLALPPERAMAYRSFGGEAEQVAKLVAASVEGLQEGGVAASVKHFPGLGGATANSDFGLALVARSRAELEREDLLPFSAAIASDVDSVMLSHGVYAGYDSEQPASVADEIVEPILREQLAYDGVAITDSLNAKGLRARYQGTVPQACVRAVEIGIDIVLLTGSAETATLCRRRITEAVERKQLSGQRVREAVLRVLALKQRLGLIPRVRPSVSE